MRKLLIEGEDETESLGGKPIRDLVSSEVIQVRLRKHIAHTLRKRGRSHGMKSIEWDVDDSYQETVCRAIDNESSFSPGPNGLAWLKKIADGVVIDTCRRTTCKAHPRCGDDHLNEIVEARSEPDRNVPEWVLSAIDRLPPKLREAIRLRYWDRLKGQSMAEALGLASERAANDLIYRAKCKLRKILGSYPA